MMGPDAPLLLSQEALDTEPMTNRLDIVSDAARVPSSNSFEIILPYLPTGRRDLLRMLTDHAPVLPGQLVWTSPIAKSEHGAKITVVRREWLDGFVGDLERERGRMLQARTARDRLLFRYVSPASRRARSITLGAWIASLMVAAIATLVSLDRSEQASSLPTVQESTISENSIFPQIGILAAIAAQPFEQLPEGTIAGISGKRDGSLLVDLNTPDPDALRDLIAERGLLPGYREFGQARRRDSGYLATYGLAGPSMAQLATPIVERVPILRARDAAQAIAQVERALIAYTTKQGLQLGVIAPAPDSEAALEFDIELAGPQEKVLAAVYAIERGSPPMRFTEWELTPDHSGDGTGDRATGNGANVRLAAKLTIPWTRPN